MLRRKPPEYARLIAMTDRPSGALREMDPLIGLTVSGRYRVHTLIGQGGMGKVFRAQQIPLGRSVALKVLEARGLDPEFHRRFFQEAAILAKMQSRHTVSIFDYGRDGDLYFIAMELVAGDPLDRVLRNTGPLPVQRVLMIAQQVCRSLREAHAQGVIHRDLKPANVMITLSEDGEELAKVLDFGLAKRVDGGGPEETQTDTVPGSPKYMAPEVIRRQEIDGRADMYSLGVMLYHMLTGIVPFDYENPMDILIAHLQEVPRSMRAVYPAIEMPHVLEQVVMRCMAKHPEERFADMHELYDVLRALMMNLGVSMEPTWAGALASPAAAGASGRPPSPSQRPPSQRPPSQRPASPSLRLSADEASTPRTSIDRRMSRTARGAWVVGISSAVVILGLVGWNNMRAPHAIAPAGVPVANAAGLSPTPQGSGAPAVPAEPDMPTMVITAEEADEGLPSVMLNVNSEPPGANVLVRGKWIGTTPVRVQWRDPQAVVGGNLVLVLRHDGYDPETIKQTIDSTELWLSAQLDRTSAPALARISDPAVPADPPVLKIAPASPDEVEEVEEEVEEEPSAEEETDRPLPSPYVEAAEEEAAPDEQPAPDEAP